MIISSTISTTWYLMVSEYFTRPESSENIEINMRSEAHEQISKL